MSTHESASSAPEESAVQRLARTRQALFRHVNRKAAHQPAQLDNAYLEQREAQGQEDPFYRPSDDSPMSGWDIAKKAAATWWEYHPARTALSVAEPVLGNYGERHPWKLLGMSAGVGALIVVARPWRMVSMTGLAIAALRSSHISAVAASLVSSRANPRTTKEHSA